jgi:hypothetical protein
MYIKSRRHIGNISPISSGRKKALRERELFIPDLSPFIDNSEQIGLTPEQVENCGGIIIYNKIRIPLYIAKKALSNLIKITEDDRFVYLEPRLRCKVKYRGWTSKGYMRLPVFQHFIF